MGIVNALFFIPNVVNNKLSKLIGLHAKYSIFESGSRCYKNGEGMKLAPHEILQYLGFKIPPEGIEINPSDAFLHAESLRLLGKTLNVAAIAESDLHDFYVESLRLFRAATNTTSFQTPALTEAHTGFVTLVEECLTEPGLDVQPDAYVANWLRLLIASNLLVIYKRQ
ncbi:MAG: hypothetical protein P8101_09535 [Candidatus Thiodiazotropha sp.]